MVNHNLAYKFHDLFEVEDIKIKETPLKWTTISLSDVLVRGKRLEASVFDVEAKQAYILIKNSKFEKVDLISLSGPVERAHYGSRLKRNYILKNDNQAIGFIGSSEMLDVKPRPEKYMVDDQRVSDLHVAKGTVLISRSGTIGNISFVNNTLSKLLISEHAIRLECREYPGYVYSYLKTKTGQALIKANIYGAVIQQIEPEHLSTIPIPNAPSKIKNKINTLIVKSYELRDESNELIDTATNLLINELQLPPIEEFWSDSSKSVETFDVKLSDINKRIDASYHVPIINKIIEHLHQQAKEVIDVGDDRISKSVILPGRFKRIYVDEGYGRIFIGGKQLGELDPSNKKYLSFVHHGKRIEEQLELHENMTLITCSGTIGKVALVGKHWENWAANQHIIRIIPASKDIAGYLNIFLQSSYGYYLITRFTYGSVVDEIDDNHVRQIPIPILKNPIIQQRINDLALQANEKKI